MSQVTLALVLLSTIVALSECQSSLHYGDYPSSIDSIYRYDQSGYGYPGYDGYNNGYGLYGYPYNGYNNYGHHGNGYDDGSYVDGYRRPYPYSAYQDRLLADRTHQSPYARGYAGSVVPPVSRTLSSYQTHYPSSTYQNGYRDGHDYVPKYGPQYDYNYKK